MKILLVYANTYTLLWPQPAGLSLIARAAREAGHEVWLVDLMFEEDPDAVLRRALEETRPELVGLSLRNLDNADLKAPRSFVPDHVRWVGMANGFAPTIIGGPAVSAAPEALLRRTGATYAMAGQGETSFPVFLRELAAGATSFAAAGLLWRDGDTIRRNAVDLSGHTRGIDWSVIDRPKYQRPYLAHGLITKSGCAHRCAFCDAHRTSGSTFLTREPEVIVEEIRREALEYRLNRAEYMLIDACFNQPVGWAKQLCEAIIRSRIKVAFGAVVEPTADLDRELCRLMVRAGSTMVTTLVASYDDRVLAEGARPFTTADVAHAFELFESEHVLYMPQLMFGGPGETEATVEASLRFARRWKPMMLQGGWGVRVYPQAPLRERAVAEGQVAADSDLLDPAFYLAPGLDPAWLDARAKSLGVSKLAIAPSWARYMWRLARLRW